MKDILKINRRWWRTGGNSTVNSTGSGPTALLNKDGYMCCLGFRCHQLGIPKKDLLFMGLPSSVKGWVIPDLVNEKRETDTCFTDIAMTINDNGDLTNEEREKKIIKHFKKKNIEVVFSGKYQKNECI